jgi:hypothetical protein
VSFLQRSAKAPRAPRPVKPRVFLTKADRKVVNALKPVEKVAGLIVSFYGAVMTFSLVALSPEGFSGTNRWRLPLGLALCAACAALAHFTNRWLVGIGAIGLVYGVPWSKWFFFALIPLGYFVFLNMRIFRDQRAMTELRASEGNFGIDPRSEAARDRRSKKDVRATEDAAGRSLAPASKRYTPPKAAKKKR